MYEEVDIYSRTKITALKKTGWVLHSLQGPAIVDYHQNGERYRDHWCRHHRRHRDKGPAVVWYDFRGSKYRAEVWLNGRRQEHLEKN